MKNEQESRRNSSIKEALSSERKRLVISKSNELKFEPDDKNTQQYFHTVKLTSIADLHALGVLPREVDENQINTAIESDDKEAYELAKIKYNFQPVKADCKDCLERDTKLSFDQFMKV